MSVIGAGRENSAPESVSDCAPLPDRLASGPGWLDVQADMTWVDGQGCACVGQAEEPADLTVAVWRKGELAANAERVVKAGGGITAEEIAAALEESGIFAAVAAAPSGDLLV